MLFKRSTGKMLAFLIVASILLAMPSIALADDRIPPKDATVITQKANEDFLKNLDLSNKEDFEDANRGFIGALEEPVIKDANGQIVWDLSKYDFIKGEDAPPTVNPSLWRQARLNMFHGLFKVTDHIYQVRGHDLSVMSIIEGKTGYIVVDPLISAECAKASLDLVYKHVGKKPVVAVIYTHSHIDHYGGVKGVISEEDVKAGKVKVIAPDGFMEAAISENVMAGNAMSRRAAYMYGAVLAKGPKGEVDAGLGKTTSAGTVTLIEPTDYIKKTGQEMTIDGVKIVFQVTPDTEAPVEMNFFFPQFRALCIAENCTHNLHNVYTLRGAKVRDAKAWAYYINEAIGLFGDKTDVIFASHHWPRWGNARIIDFMKKQRDMYKYIHDQTLRLANMGYTSEEIAEMVQLPEGLNREWYNRGYYGSVSHDVKAVFQRYLGWFDGNPADLDPLPPVPASKKFVEYMGGPDAVITKAQQDYDKGEYRWVAQVLNKVVFAYPDNKTAHDLLADAYEQLGYQAESGPWRNFYLTGADELRNGIQKHEGKSAASPDTVKAMPTELLFDYMALKLDNKKAEGKTIRINFDFTDKKKKYLLELENCALNYTPDKELKEADASIVMSRESLDKILVGKATFKEMVASGEIKIMGNSEKLPELLAMLDQFDPHFNIVTP